MSDLTQHDLIQLLKMAIKNKDEFNSLPEDEARQFLRGLFDAADTFYAVWKAKGGFEGLLIKASCRRKQHVGALLVKDQQFAEAWKAMHDQAAVAPAITHDMPAGVM
jgi:hypothetical protein